MPSFDEMKSSPVQSFTEAVRELHPEYFEITVMDGCLVTAPDSDVEPILQAWAEEFHHELRPLGRRNPVIWLSREAALAWVKNHLVQDVVFQMPCIPEPDATRLATTLFDELGDVQAISLDFAISDWTFCDLLIVSNRSRTLLLAFPGED